MGAALAATPAAAAPAHAMAGRFASAHMPAVNALPSAAMSITPPSSGAAPYMVYSGGQVISNVRVTSVYWGSNVSYKDEIDAFYRDITNSSFIDQLAEYSTPNQTIKRGSFAGRVTLNPTIGSFIQDYQIQTTLIKAVGEGTVPNNTDGNSLLMLHFPADTYIALNGAWSCWSYLAYHSSFLINSTMFTYGVIPDQGGLCARDTSNMLPGAQLGQTTIAASHELAESITNPGVGLALEPLGPPLAWYDPAVGEIADACVNQTGSVGQWFVQKVWSKNDNGCIGPGT